MVLTILNPNNQKAKWSYGLLDHNCQHFVTYVTFGKKQFTQKNNLKRERSNQCSRTTRTPISGKDCVSNCITKTTECKDKKCLNITVTDLGICRDSKGDLAPPHKKFPNLYKSYCYIGKKCISKNNSKCLFDIRTQEQKYGCEKDGTEKINKCVYTNDLPPYI